MVCGGGHWRPRLPWRRFLLSFLLLDAAAVAFAACGPSPDANATSGALWTDEDGPGSAFTTNASESCTWQVDCALLPSGRTRLVITLDFDGHGFGVAVYNSSSAFVGHVVPNPYSTAAASVVVASISPPFTIVTSGSIYLPSPFNGAAVYFTCYREVDPQLVQVDLRSRETGTMTLSPDNYTQEDPFNGTVPLFAHLVYNVTCPQGQSLQYGLTDVGDVSDTFTLQKAQGYGPWTSMSYKDYKWSEPTWSDSFTSWLVLDLAGYGAGKSIRITFNCTPHQFSACANRHPQPALQYDRVDTFAMQSREKGILYRYASTSRGNSDGEPTPLDNVCPLHAYCVDSDHEVVVSSLKLYKQIYWTFDMVNPDGSVRSRLQQGIKIIIDGMHSAFFGAETDVTFPLQRLSKATTLNSQPSATYPYPLPAALIGKGGVLFNASVSGDNSRSWDLLNYRAGFDIYMECRRREPVDLRPSVDLVAAAAKDAYGLASTRDVTLEQWASVQPTGYQSQFRLYPYNDTDLAIHNQAESDYAAAVAVANAKGQRTPPLPTPFSNGDVHPVVVPVTCGLFSNVFISLEDIQNYTWVELGLRPAFIDRGNSTSLRFVSANRRSDTDAQPWGYSYSARFPGVVSYLLESPAEIQWSGVRLPASLSVPSVKITVKCTLHGRNGPLPTYSWPFNTTLFLSAVAQPSSFLKPMKESAGRIDAVSSDADGGLGTFTTTGNVVANISCPRRFQQCTIVIKQIYASLHPMQQSLTIIAADGTTLLSESGARPIQTVGDFVDAGLYAFNGATITLTSMTPSVSSNGFTITYAMDSTESIMSAATPTLSRSRSYVLTASQPKTVTRPPTPSKSGTDVLTDTLTFSRVPPPTRTRSRRPTTSRSQASSTTTMPPPPAVPGAPSAGTASVLAASVGVSPAAATAIAATGATGAALGGAVSPGSANKAAMTAQLVQTATCRLLDGDDLSSFPAPDASALLPSLPGVLPSDLLSDTASSLLSTVGLGVAIALICAMAATAPEERTRGTTQRRSGPRRRGEKVSFVPPFPRVAAVATTLYALWLGYFGPTVLSVAVTLLRFPTTPVVGRVCAATAFCVTVLLSACTAVVTRAPPPSSLSFTLKPTLRIKLAAVCKNFSSGSRDDGRWYIRGFVFEDMWTAFAIGAVGGVYPSSPSGCIAGSSVMVAIATLHLGYVLALRPHESRVEWVVAVLGAALTFAIAVLALLTVFLNNSATVYGCLGAALLAANFYFVASSFVLLAASVAEWCRQERHRKRAHRHRNNDAARLATVPALAPRMEAEEDNGHPSSLVAGAQENPPLSRFSLLTLDAVQEGDTAKDQEREDRRLRREARRLEKEAARLRAEARRARKIARSAQPDLWSHVPAAGHDLDTRWL